MSRFLARVAGWKESENCIYGITDKGVTAGEALYYKEEGIAGALYIGQVHNLIATDSLKGSSKLTSLNEVCEGKRFNYVSLFSGIGGFEQALNKLGGNCVMASEIDKYANQAYEALYGHSTIGDVTKLAAEDVPDHDVIVGGFPCQAFSNAGKRLGFKEARGTLFFEIARIAKVKQPKALLLENVTGLISHDKGKTLDTIIQTLYEIGYTVDFEVMNSKYFGVPQNRRRIFIVAVRNDLVCPTEWNVGKRSDAVAKGKKRIAKLGVKTFNFDWPTQADEKVTVSLADILEDDVDEKFYLSEEKTAKLVTHIQNGLAVKEATKKGYAVASEGDAVNFQFPDSATRRGRIGKQMANTLEASGINQGVVTPGFRIRKLTPLECWRLQGFPDEAHAAVENAGVPQSQRYKQAGNAVSVPVISALGKRLLPLISNEGAN